jgi:hypothetical protein
LIALESENDSPVTSPLQQTITTRASPDWTASGKTRLIEVQREQVLEVVWAKLNVARAGSTKGRVAATTDTASIRPTRTDVVRLELTLAGTNVRARKRPLLLIESRPSDMNVPLFQASHGCSMTWERDTPLLSLQSEVILLAGKSEVRLERGLRLPRVDESSRKATSNDAPAIQPLHSHSPYRSCSRRRH